MWPILASNSNLPASASSVFWNRSDSALSSSVPAAAQALFDSQGLRTHLEGHFLQEAVPYLGAACRLASLQ